MSEYTHEREQREAYVVKRFDFYRSPEMSMLVYSFDRDEMRTELAELTEVGEESRFGWTYPFDDDNSPTALSLAVCYDMIVDQSLHLDFALFREYVDVIEYRLNLHITLYDEFPQDERARIIDNLLYDKGPGSMQILNDVQLHVLDGGSV